MLTLTKSRVVALACLVILAGAPAGCTLAGTAVGASIPRYETRTFERDELPIGTMVRVRVRSVGADSMRLAEIVGRYGGIRDGLRLVTADDGAEHEIPARDVFEIEVRNGTEWKKGLLLGAAADAIVAVVVIGVASGANLSVSTGSAP